MQLVPPIRDGERIVRAPRRDGELGERARVARNEVLVALPRKDLVSGETKTLHRLANEGRNDAEVFGDDRSLSRRLEHRREDLLAARPLIGLTRGIERASLTGLRDPLTEETND